MLRARNQPKVIIKNLGGSILLNNKIPIIGILGILVLVVAVSGCTSSGNEKLVFQYSLPPNGGDAYPTISDSYFTNVTYTENFEQNVTLPNGTKSVRVEYENISMLNSSQGSAYLDVTFLSVVPGPVNSQYYTPGGKTPYADFESAGNILDAQRVDINSTSHPSSDNLSYSKSSLFINNFLKGIVIDNENIKGTIKVYATT